MKKILYLCFVLQLLLCNLSCSKEGTAKNFGPTTGTGGSMARFTIVGDHLYIIDKSSLKVFDISSQEKPVLKNNTEVGFEIETIFPFKDMLFIGSTTVVHIFSIEDPDHPKKLSTAISPEVMRRCDPVVAKDTVAYATLRTSGPCGGIESRLAVYDIKNILSPVLVASQSVAEPYGLGYAGNALYVCDRNSLVIFDISNGFQPQRINQLVTDEQFYDIIPFDNTLVCWSSNGVALYNISERFEPQLIANIN